MSQDNKVYLTDIVHDALVATSQIYMHNAMKFAEKGHAVLCAKEIEKCLAIEHLTDDIHICEMIAGRLRQFMAAANYEGPGATVPRTEPCRCEVEAEERAKKFNEQARKDEINRRGY